MRTSLLSRLRAPLAVLTLIAVLSSAACGDSPQSVSTPVRNCSVSPNSPLTIAVGAHANTPAAVLPDQVDTIVHNFVDSQPSGHTSPPVTVLDVDGRPAGLITHAFLSHASSSTSLGDDQSAFVNGITKFVGQTRAEAAQVDDLTALTDAARGQEGGGTIVFLDSGLQTVPPLDFTRPGLLDADPDDVVKQLSDQHELPELTGQQVLFFGLGSTAAPQQNLDPAQQAHLGEIYQKIAYAGHAKCVTVVLTAAGGPATSGTLPAVSLVPVPPIGPINPADGGTVVLPNNQTVGFVPNKAQFINPTAANKVLLPLGQWLGTHPHAHITITGTTARWGTRAWQITLSKERAAAVAQVLLGDGVQQGQINTRGVGSYFPQYVNDQDGHGGLIASYAQQNRTVRLAWTP